MGEREQLGSMMGGGEGPEAVPAATVVLARQHELGHPEVLMLHRDSRLSFAGGMWVFPGGRVDPGDHVDDPDAGRSLRLAEERAAIREAFEESGLELTVGDLIRYSHWTPPPQAHKRFSTAFFVAPAPKGDVTIDDGEIRDHRWVSPTEALASHQRNEIELAPPTFITLTYLSAAGSLDELLQVARRGPIEHFTTQIVDIDGQIAALYHGDVGYDGADPGAEGPRHRLWLDPAGWRYERR